MFASHFVRLIVVTTFICSAHFRNAVRFILITQNRNANVTNTVCFSMHLQGKSRNVSLKYGNI